MKNFDEMDLEWQPMYKPASVDALRYEVLKLEPSQYATLMIRPDTGECAILCVHSQKSLADAYVKYKNANV